MHFYNENVDISEVVLLLSMVEVPLPLSLIHI